MPQTPKSMLSIEGFEHMLDAFGADPNRWPEQRRAAAEMLLAHDHAARRLLTEAEALDALLNKLPDEAAPEPARTAQLADRILAKAHSAPRLAHTAEPSAVPTRARREEDNADRRQALAVAQAKFAVTRTSFAAGAFLAASLAAGIYIGQASLSSLAASAVEQLAAGAFSLSDLNFASLDDDLDDWAELQSSFEN